MNPVALITGGQRGIGLGIAKTLVNNGFRVALMAPVPPNDADVVSGLDALGDSARFFSHDVRNVEEHDGLLDQIEADLGPVGTFISNAGVPAPIRGDMLELLPENFDFVFDVNVRGAFFLAQAVARRMTEKPSQAYQSLIFISSVSASMVSIERAEYCLSKSAAAMMADLFAVRLAASGIGVFEVRPGIIETPMTSGVKDAYTARIENGLVPAGRWGTPEDIGKLILPLVRGDMAFATGSTINADGGLSIPRL